MGLGLSFEFCTQEFYFKVYCIIWSQLCVYGSKNQITKKYSCPKLYSHMGQLTPVEYSTGEPCSKAHLYFFRASTGKPLLSRLPDFPPSSHQTTHTALQDSMVSCLNYSNSCGQVCLLSAPFKHRPYWNKRALT